jgi:hypothetical protein
MSDAMLKPLSFRQHPGMPVAFSGTGFPMTIIHAEDYLLVGDLQPLTVTQVEEQLDGLPGLDQAPRLFTSLSFFTKRRPLGPTARPVVVIVAEHGTLLTSQGTITTATRPRPMLSRLGFGDARPKDVRICAYHSGAYHNLGMHELPEDDTALPGFLGGFLPQALPGAVPLDLARAEVRTFADERGSWAKAL